MKPKEIFEVGNEELFSHFEELKGNETLKLLEIIVGYSLNLLVPLSRKLNSVVSKVSGVQPKYIPSYSTSGGFTLESYVSHGKISDIPLSSVINGVLSNVDGLKPLVKDNIFVPLDQAISIAKEIALEFGVPNEELVLTCAYILMENAPSDIQASVHTTERIVYDEEEQTLHLSISPIISSEDKDPSSTADFICLRVSSYLEESLSRLGVKSVNVLLEEELREMEETGDAKLKA